MSFTKEPKRQTRMHKIEKIQNKLKLLSFDNIILIHGDEFDQWV